MAKKIPYTTKIIICRIAAYAAEKLKACRSPRKRKIYEQIIYEAYIDITRG